MFMQMPLHGTYILLHVINKKDEYVKCCIQNKVYKNHRLYWDFIYLLLYLLIMSFC